jgi:hypothetical protein
MPLSCNSKPEFKAIMIIANIPVNTIIDFFDFNDVNIYINNKNIPKIAPFFEAVNMIVYSANTIFTGKKTVKILDLLFFKKRIEMVILKSIYIANTLGLFVVPVNLCVKCSVYSLT